MGGEELRASPYTPEEKSLVHNLTSLYFTIFGINFDVHYYPIARVMASDRRMQELTNRLVIFVRQSVAARKEADLWVNEFAMLYYASIYTRTTAALVQFMALRFKYEFHWGQPLGLMFKVVSSVDLATFGIAGIKIGFHGRFSGRPRAYRLARIWGRDPCLRNNHLTGSYSSAQCLSKYGITHIHIWMT